MDRCPLRLLRMLWGMTHTRRARTGAVGAADATTSVEHFLKKKLLLNLLLSAAVKMTAANAVIALFYSGIAPGKIHIFRRFFDTLEWAG